jgi:dCMP deaminase
MMNSREWMLKWDARFMKIAVDISEWSKDRSTKVGCIVVRERRILSTGYNGFPRGCDDDVEARHERPLKYLWVAHAEANAVYNATRDGVMLEGATAYVTMFPCADCAKALIQTGIHRIVAHAPNLACERWGAQQQVAIDMLTESGVIFEPVSL